MTEDEDDYIDDLIYLYVEKRTGLLHEVQLFNDFVLVRSATPEFRVGSMQKLSNNMFHRAFEEYQGDQRYAKAIAEGYADGLVVTMK